MCVGDGTISSGLHWPEVATWPQGHLGNVVYWCTQRRNLISGACLWPLMMIHQHKLEGFLILHKAVLGKCSLNGSCCFNFWLNIGFDSQCCQKHKQKDWCNSGELNRMYPWISLCCLLFIFFWFCAIPGSAQSLRLALCSRSHMGCREWNLGQLHAMQVSYLCTITHAHP